MDVAEFLNLYRAERASAILRTSDRQLARNAAHLYARCRWAGLTPGSGNDCLIACCAIEARQPLLHEDQDFRLIARVEPALVLMG